MRIVEFQSQRLWQTLWTGVALALTLGFTILINRSITSPLAALKNLLHTNVTQVTSAVTELAQSTNSLSAGASEYLPIAKVTNIARTVDELKDKNIWIVGLDERGSKDYDALDYNMDCGIVLGAEGKGVHDLVRKKCDYLVSIPMLGKVSSLNVSVAAAVMLYEIVRQRRKKAE